MKRKSYRLHPQVVPSLIVPTNICRPRENKRRLSLLRETLDSIQSHSLTLQMKKLRPKSRDKRTSHSGLKLGHESRSPTLQRCAVGIRKCSKRQRDGPYPRPVWTDKAALLGKQKIEGSLTDGEKPTIPPETLGSPALSSLSHFTTIVSF